MSWSFQATHTPEHPLPNRCIRAERNILRNSRIRKDIGEDRWDTLVGKSDGNYTMCTVYKRVGREAIYQTQGAVPDAGIKDTSFIALPSRELSFRGNKQLCR